MTQITVNGNTYSDAGEAANDMRGGGHRTHLLPMLGDAITDLAAKQAAAELAETNAAASEAAAAVSAASAAALAGAFVGTSTTSLLIELGSKSFTTQAGEQYTAGIYMTAVSAAAPANWMYGQVTSYSGTTLVLDVQAIGGSGTYADWNLSMAGVRGPAGADGTSASLIRSARTSNTMLGTADMGKLIDCSGTWTQTFDAAATLGDGWYCYIRNSGTGDITLDPNASETIDGLTSYIMYPGEVRLIQCDGTALRSVVLNSFRRTFTASGTFTTPPGYMAFAGHLWAGGASGGKGGTSGTATGGGGGACVPYCLPSASFGATETVTIGAGGAAVTASATVGNQGGNSSLGALVSAYGGGAGYAIGSATTCGGGSGGGALSAGVQGNVSSQSGGQPCAGVAYGFTNEGYGGASSLAGSVGFDSAYGGASGGGYHSSGVGYAGGNSVYGGAAGGGVGSGGSASLAGGVSVFGGNGGASNRTTSGVDGSAPGGGGGATQTGTNSGAGAPGQLDIWGVA